jgi:hypothetical protein
VNECSFNHSPRSLPRILVTNPQEASIAINLPYAIADLGRIPSRLSGPDGAGVCQPVIGARDFIAIALDKRFQRDHPGFYGKVRPLDSKVSGSAGERPSDHM